MKCPYCYKLGLPYSQHNLYQSDASLLTSSGLVDVYECSWHNARFVVKAGDHLFTNSFEQVFDLLSGVQLSEGSSEPRKE